MSTSDEQFEMLMRRLDFGAMDISRQLRARDTAQREALARVEAERDLAVSQRDHNLYSARLMTEAAEEAQAQLAEAVGLLKHVKDWFGWGDLPESLSKLDSFLSRHAQAEQQEAREPVLARPEHGVSMDEALALTMDRYSGAMEKLAASELQEAQGAQAGDDIAHMQSVMKGADDDLDCARRLHAAGYRRVAGEPVRVVVEPGEELSPSNLVGNRIDRTLTIGTRLYTAPTTAAHEDEPVGETALVRKTHYQVRNMAMGTDWVNVSFNEYMQAVNLVEYQCRIIKEPS